MDVLSPFISLSSVILIDSSTESPEHVLMLSTQAVRGLPRLRAPGIIYKDPLRFYDLLDRAFEGGARHRGWWRRAVPRKRSRPPRCLLMPTALGRRAVPLQNPRDDHPEAIRRSTAKFD